MSKRKAGIIGLGNRGMSLLEHVILALSDYCDVTAVCDVYEDRMMDAKKLIMDKGQKEPLMTKDYKELIDSDIVDTVFVFSSWETHSEMAIYAMNAKKAVAIEVGGVYNIDECYRMVEAYERTKTPFMFLENCCFGRREMMALNMVQKGVFGEIVHCSGGYCHDLRYEVSHGRELRHYRLDNYLNRNCENYPTHELGPIAKVLNINHGNRLLSLVSVASKSAGLHDYINLNKSDDEVLKNAKFAQGDIITTIIKCANGETITITLDTTLPRFYSRGFTVRGTRGMYEEATDSVFLDSNGDNEHDFDWRETQSGNAKNYEDEYDHPVWKKYIEDGVQGTHDGMDWLEFKTFFECLKNNEPIPVDVYDAATWMSITALSEQSITTGLPVAIPDFTKGKWIKG